MRNNKQKEFSKCCDKCETNFHFTKEEILTRKPRLDSPPSTIQELYLNGTVYFLNCPVCNTENVLYAKISGKENGK